MPKNDIFENEYSIEVINNNGKIRIPNKQAQADVTVIKTEKTVGGKTIYKKATTTNDEKIADTCIEIFQNANLEKHINLDAIKEKAFESVEKLFSEKNLVISENNTKKENELIEKKQKIAYNQYIKKYIDDNLSSEYSIDFGKFIELTGIKSAQRIGNALELLDNIQNKNFYSWNEEKLNDKFEIVNEIVKIAVIPEIRLILDNKIGGLLDENGNKLYNSIRDLIKANIKNKKKYIQKITFKINAAYISNILGLERDYTEPDRKQRINFKSSGAFRLDTLLRSIEKIQNYPNKAHFTFEQIQKKFGTQYQEYKNFKRRVLEPAIDDLNKYTNLNVELIEVRKGGPKTELQYIKFKITRKNNTDKERYGVEKTAFYIGSRIFYFSKSNIKNLIAFSKDIENKQKESLDITIYENKDYLTWKDEAEKAYRLEDKLKKLISDNKLFIDQHNLVYCDKRMCLVKQVPADDENELLKNSLLKYNDRTVTNPMESIEYLEDLLKTGYSDRADIFDFIPFEVTSSNQIDWILISNMIDYQNNEELILKNINEKKLKYFKFTNDEIAEIFYRHIYRGNFRQIDNDISKLKNEL